ncbi:integral membrane protein [Talaromyces pinophilus]|uniref:Integral membrane protein n=1 Tax=Talaromyces pinophilus TaxID=128442 RepID=A0A0B8MXE9_TALPI|nr:integral membrane protein [Talaromyces pinophilus]
MTLFSTIMISLLGFGLASSITELGMVAYGVWFYGQTITYEYYCGYDICDETVKGTVPDVVSFLMFAAVWSTLVTAAAIGLPLFYHKRDAHHHNKWLAPTLIVLYFLTWVFWLAGFAYLAYLIGSNGTGIIAAILAFGIINWLLYTGIFILSFLAIFDVMQGEWPGYLVMKGRASSSGPPATETTAYAGAPAEPKYEGNHELTA